MAETIFKKISDDWLLVKNACRTTVRKQFSENEVRDGFKKQILISEHSPIRLLEFYWKWDNIPYDIAMHWARHKFEKFISTQRNDRQNDYDRDAARQDTPVLFNAYANMQNLIDAWRKRLCFQAESRTRQYAEDFKTTLHKTHPYEADVLVPNCVYRGGCPEMFGCKFWEEFQKGLTREQLTDIQARYDAYNAMFYKRKEE